LIAGLPAWAAAGEVLYESPRQAQAIAGQFTDWFAPFDVHVYHFRRTDENAIPAIPTGLVK